MGLLDPDNRPWGTCLTELQLPARRPKDSPMRHELIPDRAVAQRKMFDRKVAEPIKKKVESKRMGRPPHLVGPPKKLMKRARRRTAWVKVENPKGTGICGPPQPFEKRPSNSLEKRREYNKRWRASRTPEQKEADWKRGEANRDKARKVAYYKAKYQAEREKVRAAEKKRRQDAKATRPTGRGKKGGEGDRAQ